MKITVLADRSGAIVGAHYSVPSRAPLGVSSVQITASDDQRIHEVELPDPLGRQILDGTFAKELAKYRVEGSGRRAKLVKSSERETTEGNRRSRTRTRR